MKYTPVWLECSISTKDLSLIVAELISELYFRPFSRSSYPQRMMIGGPGLIVAQCFFSEAFVGRFPCGPVTKVDEREALKRDFDSFELEKTASHSYSRALVRFRPRDHFYDSRGLSSENWVILRVTSSSTAEPRPIALLRSQRR